MASAADIASVFPGAQTIVGYSTMASNAYKSAIDFRMVTISGFHITKNLAQAGYKIVHRKLTDPSDENLQFDKEINDHMINVQSQLPIAVLGSKKLCRHVAYMAIGYVRATPLWGTIFSIGRCLYT